MFANLTRWTIVVGCLLGILAIVPDAAAQRFDRGTKITINQPFEIPGVALPAGTYVFRLLDVGGSRSVVQVLNAKETKSYAIVIGIPDYKLDTPEKTELSFYEAYQGVPIPLRAWFYPGFNYGVEFIYPKERAEAIARMSGAHVLAMSEAAAEPEAEVELEPVAVEPSGKITDLEIIHRKPDAPLVEPAEPEPAPLPASEVLPAEELPKTATPLPLVGLAGLLAAGAAGALHITRKRCS
jgi:hypothetical protein